MTPENPGIQALRRRISELSSVKATSTKSTTTDVNPATSLVDTILRRINAIAPAKAPVPPSTSSTEAVTSLPIAPAFPSEWFQGLMKPAPSPETKPTKAPAQTGTTATRPVAARVVPSSLRPVLSFALPDVGTSTVFIVPIYSTSREAMQLGTYYLLDHESTTFIGMMMLIGTSYLCWTAPDQSPLAARALATHGVTITDGPTCPESVRNALEAGAVAVCADYELTMGFYRRTGWPEPCRWYDLMAATSVLNFPRDLIGVATVLGHIPLPQSQAGLRQ